jgi:hypothetical protein
MSSIGEAKGRIAAGSESADEAKRALKSAGKAVEEALVALKQAADGSGHAKVTEALGAYQDATSSLRKAAALLSSGQRAADEYAGRLG